MHRIGVSGEREEEEEEEEMMIFPWADSKGNPFLPLGEMFGRQK